MPSRSDNLATIAEHFRDFHTHADLVVFRKLFDKRGFDIFTDEALSEIADHYAWTAADRERRTEANRPFERAAAGLSSSPSRNRAA